MSIGRILTQGLGSFGGRKYLPTLGLGALDSPPVDLPILLACFHASQVYCSGFEATRIYTDRFTASQVYASGFDATQTGCC